MGETIERLRTARPFSLRTMAADLRWQQRASASLAEIERLDAQAHHRLQHDLCAKVDPKSALRDPRVLGALLSAEPTASVSASRIEQLCKDCGFRQEGGAGTLSAVLLIDGELATFGGYEFSKFAELLDAERCQVQVAVQAATEILEKTPPAFEFVDRSLSAIAIRRDLTSLKATSSSWSRLIGYGAINNPASVEFSASFIVDALVREAVHNMLHRIESAAPMLVARPPGRLRLRSPWNENSLQLRDYVHACFVWYALAWFWGGEPGPPGADRQYFLKLATRGFSQQPADALRSYRSWLGYEVYETVADLHNNLPI